MNKGTRAVFMMQRYDKVQEQLNDEAKGKWKLVTKDRVNDYDGMKSVKITLQRYCL